MGGGIATCLTDSHLEELRTDMNLDQDLELIVEKKGSLCGRLPLRVYRSRFSPNDLDMPVEEWRFHFGFPRELVEPIVLLLETTPYWGGRHWKEEGGFWLWRLTVRGNQTPWDKLRADLQFKVRSFNRVLCFCRKASSSA